MGKTGYNKFTLTQTGIIDKVLRESNVQACNSDKTHAASNPLDKNIDGESFNETWDYASVLISMVMYFETNSRYDIIYAVK